MIADYMRSILNINKLKINSGKRHTRNTVIIKICETLLILDKINFKSGSILTDKERHFIMRRGSVNQEDILIINVYAPNRRNSK